MGRFPTIKDTYDVKMSMSRKQFLDKCDMSDYCDVSDVVSGDLLSIRDVAVVAVALTGLWEYSISKMRGAAEKKREILHAIMDDKKNLKNL